MRTIDYIQDWTVRFEEAGFDVETTTEEIVSDLAFVRVEAEHECGETFSFEVSVHDGQIDHRSTKFMIAHRVAPYGTAGAAWSTYKTRGEAAAQVSHCIYNARRLSALATEEV